MDFLNNLRSRPLQVASIIILAFILYSNTLFNDFLYDDIKQVLDNPWIKDIRYLPEIFFQKTWGFDPTHTTSSYYRPMMHLVFMAEYSIFGFKAWGWHLTNIVFHALNGIFVFLLSLSLLNKSSKKGSHAGLSSGTLALGAALLFISHPARTEVVAWVSAVPELAFTLFLLISLYLYTLYREEEKIRLLIISAAFFLLSTLSKESSLALPILIVAIDIITRDKKRSFILPFRYIPYIIVIIIYFALRINALQGLTPRPGSHSYLSGFQYFLNVFPLFIDHIKTLVLPVKLSIFHVFHPVYSLGEARSILSIVVTLLILALFYRLRKIDRLYLFALALIVIPLLPALYIPALDRNPFAERYLYLPGAGLALFTVLLLRETYDYHCKKGGGLALTYVTIPFIVLITLYGVGTIKRNLDWKSRFTLWNSSVASDAQNYYALAELGKYYLSIDNTSEAIVLFEASIKANKKRRDLDPLILGLTHLSLADSYRQAKEPNKAITNYSAVLKMDPNRFDANLNIAILYHELGKLKLAAKHYLRALERAADNEDKAGILMNIGNIHAQKKEWSKAHKIYSQALKIMPDDPLILRNMTLIKERSSK